MPNNWLRAQEVEQLDSSSLLEELETSVERTALEFRRSSSPAGPDIGTLVRHAKWSRKRQAIHDALRDSGCPANRLARFAGCGSNAWVLQHPSNPGTFRMAANKCHDRFCEPCSHERGRMYARQLADKLDAERTRFITLTLRHVDQPLAEQLDHLTASFRRLRQRKLWKSTQEGGVATIELKYNTSTDRWHPHLHILAVGQYIKNTDLAKEWEEVTGGSYIIDIRAIRSTTEALSYVIKYIGKTISLHSVSNPERACEVIRALSARRTILSFGTLKMEKPEQVPEQTADWHCLGTIESVIKLARESDPVARNACAFLGIDWLQPLMVAAGDQEEGDPCQSRKRGISDSS